ncbi:MAG: hypothetical protein KatS3mg103_1116 [Phycisphaerales bacterium]|nr:MAG: hypothetical protein KatS3mg103_1116 [Phycisphaerales bacterium]
MPSSYNGAALFGSGPHRFIMERQGQTEIPPGTSPTMQSQPNPKWLQIGLVQLSVVVRGRLVAQSEEDLWTLRNAITAALTPTPSPGTLEDHGGQTWTNMWLVRYVEKGPVDVGRTWSIAYEAVFRKVGQ